MACDTAHPIPPAAACSSTSGCQWRLESGELTTLDPEPHSASVTALEDIRLLGLHREDLYELMSAQPWLEIIPAAREGAAFAIAFGLMVGKKVPICLIQNTGLLESGDSVGGIMATCPGMPIGAAYPNGMSIGGILDDFLNRLYRMNPPAAEKRICRLAEFGPEVFYDHEIAIFTLFQMLQEAGVNLLLDATALAPVLDNENVTGVVYYDKGGRNIVTAKIVIYCSGDGHIAAKSGVPYEKGDEAQGQMMAVSLTFFMANVEVDKIEEYARSKKIDTLYLLTLTAENFFSARGYHKTDRKSAPPALQETTEFKSLCPQTAVCMKKHL